MADVLEIAAKQAKLIRIDGKDYDLMFPLSVVVSLENRLGRPMKSAPDWLRTTAAEVPTILEAGLSIAYPNEAKEIADAVCMALNPEEISTVIDALCAAACPKAMARIEAEMKKARERMQASQSN